MKFSLRLFRITAMFGIALMAAPALAQNTPTPAATSTTTAAACTHCFDAGPFVAEITSLSPSWNNTHRIHILRVNLRFKNTSPAPVILAFPWRSNASVTDNYGNAYGIDYRFPQNIVGIGIVSNQEANTNFSLAPGASRTASLIFSHNVGNTEVGNVFTIDFSVNGLKVVSGSNRVTKTDDYALNFPDVSASAMSQVNDLGKSISDALGSFGKKKH